MFHRTYFFFLIIAMHMMNRELIPGKKRGFNGVLYKL